jgi:hypothetical protein
LAAGFMMALQEIIYAVDGWEGVIYFGEEVRNPGRDIPRAIFAIVFSITTIYLLLSAAVAYVLPMREIVGNDFALSTAASRIFGTYGDPVIRSLMHILLASCINTSQLFASRTLYRMSTDGLFFRAASRMNKGRASPSLGLKHRCGHGVLHLSEIYSRHRHAGGFLRRQLHAFLRLHVSAQNDGTGNGAAVSRVGLSADSRSGTGEFHCFPGGCRIHGDRVNTPWARWPC